VHDRVARIAQRRVERTPPPASAVAQELGGAGSGLSHQTIPSMTRKTPMATKETTKAERRSQRPQRNKPEMRGGSTPDVLEILEQDHREVEEMFNEYDELPDGDKRKGELARDICRALEVHAQIEEEIFYPRAREATKDDDLIDEAVVEHASVKHLIGEIRSMKVGDELYDARIRVLEEIVKRHIQEEEEELFPELVSAGMDVTETGRQLAERKQELMTETGV
jgi:hemerythrin superfamily protein